MFDPQGEPAQCPLVNPHVNVLTGNIWILMGDDGNSQGVNRFWALRPTYENVGALGIRNETIGTTLPVGQGNIATQQD